MLDTHLLLWAAQGSDRLGAEVRGLIEDEHNDLLFSVASIWEIVIKSGLGRADFEVDPVALRSGLIAAGYGELDVRATHVLAVADLPSLHRDPFDRLLVAQALGENATLVTADGAVSGYPGKIKLV
nr:type II toxin-antitoxin system VapC family toxin [Sphingomonas chungangi]